MGLFNVEREDVEIDDTLNVLVEADERGTTLFPGKTYEQGVLAGIQWVTDETADDPLGE